MKNISTTKDHEDMADKAIPKTTPPFEPPATALRRILGERAIQIRTCIRSYGPADLTGPGV